MAAKTAAAYRAERRAALDARDAARRQANPEAHADLMAWWDSTEALWTGAPQPESDPAEFSALDGLVREFGSGSGRSPRPIEGPTEKQESFLARLVAEKGVPAPVVTTKREASAAIDRLMKLPNAAPVDVAVAAIEGRWCKVGQTWAVRATGAKTGDTIDVRKASGETKSVTLGAALSTGVFAVAAERRDVPCETSAPTSTIPAGHYAVASNGENDLLFVRVDHGKGAYGGRVFVKMIVGGHPERNVPTARVASILARIEADGVDVSARRYGQEIGRCCLCNRHLTDEASRLAGIGPECAKK